MHIIDLHFLGIPQANASYLLETSAGPILIESGPHSTFETLKKGINDLGFKVSDIQHLFLSHIHFDHAGAAWAFAEQGATIYVHPFGAPHLSHPERLVESARRIYKDQMDSLWGAMNPIPKEQIISVKNEEEFTIGDTTMKAWHTPGHAVHHIAWQFGDELMAGDVAGVKINGEMVVPPCPPPDINIEDWVASINILRSLNLKTIYISHFGKITNIETHLNELEEILWDWANWMKPHFEAGSSVPEIVPLFVEHVKNQMLEKGMSEAAVKQYEASNPSFMSVAGLMRYWKKKTQA